MSFHDKCDNESGWLEIMTNTQASIEFKTNFFHHNELESRISE